MNEELLAGEFADAGLGDERLDRRLTRVATRLATKPTQSFPTVFPQEADLEAFYRLIRNDRVTPETVLEPHIQATVERAAGFDEVLAIHDTTEFRFKGDRAGLGRLTTSGRGFLGHFSLVASTDGRREPLGVMSVHTWARTKESATAKRQAKKVTYAESRDLPTEQRRWGKQVDDVELKLGGASSVVHVMDSEADDYTLLSKLVEDDRRFVIRLCYDRVLDVDASDSAPHRKTKSFVAAGQTVATRTVKLSKRKRQPGGGKRLRSKERKERLANLAISATPVVFRRSGSASTKLRDRLAVHVVNVRETKPPPDAVPVEWNLITNEPIESQEQILRVVDYYRTRWLIEEYFKALKTGCAYETRQLESLDTLLAALSIFVPIAWSLLRLRNVAKSTPDQPAATVLTSMQLHVLRGFSPLPLPNEPTARDALLSVAKLGGHLKQNGEPGWQVLSRGYYELLRLTAGYQLAAAKM